MPSPAHRPIAWILGLLFLLSPALAGRLQPNAYTGGRSRDADARAIRNASSIGALFGEVRTALSDILMIKTERYMHNGVAYRPKPDKPNLVTRAAHPTTLDLGPQPVATNAHADDAHDTGQPDHDHGPACSHGEGEDDLLFNDEGADTVITGADRDFRGVIGKLHRAVAPYQDAGQAHQHSAGVEILPWFRIMTLSDPQFVAGYATGAWWLRREDAEQALAFADEGIAGNPDAVSIYAAKGQVLLSQARKCSPDLSTPNAEARRYLVDALTNYQRGAEAVERQWLEAGAEGRESWTSYQWDDAMAVLRMAAMLERKVGDPEQATALARSYLALVGHDATLARVAGLDETGPSRSDQASNSERRNSG